MTPEEQREKALSLMERAITLMERNHKLIERAVSIVEKLNEEVQYTAGYGVAILTHEFVKSNNGLCTYQAEPDGIACGLPHVRHKSHAGYVASQEGCPSTGGCMIDGCVYPGISGSCGARGDEHHKSHSGVAS